MMLVLICVCVFGFFNGICISRTGFLFPDVGIRDFGPSFCLRLCTNWRTELATMVLMPWMKLMRFWLS